MAQESFEARLERLKIIVQKLEREALPLEEGVALYKEGLQIAQACGKQLETAHHEVSIVSKGLIEEFNILESLGEEDD